MFRSGQKVTYRYNNGEGKIGIVKTVKDGKVYVVYYCGNDWKNYRNYTAALSDPKRLTKGWK